MDNVRNFKEFLQVFNQITETCFYKCLEHTYDRMLSHYEIECVEKCATKFLRYNNKLITNFYGRQNELLARRLRENEELEKQRELAAEQNVTSSES